MKIIRDIILSASQEGVHSIFINDNGEQMSFDHTEKDRVKTILAILGGKALVPTHDCVEVKSDYNGTYEIHETGLGIIVTLINYKGGKY